MINSRFLLKNTVYKSFLIEISRIIAKKQNLLSRRRHQFLNKYLRNNKIKEKLIFIAYIKKIHIANGDNFLYYLQATWMFLQFHQLRENIYAYNIPHLWSSHDLNIRAKNVETGRRGALTFIKTKNFAHLCKRARAEDSRLGRENITSFYPQPHLLHPRRPEQINGVRIFYARNVHIAVSSPRCPSQAPSAGTTAELSRENSEATDRG